MKKKESKHMDIIVMFSTFKEKRLKLYESFIRDIDDFDTWAISAERLLAYYITARNIRDYGNIAKEQVQKEIIRLQEGDYTSH